MRLIEFFEDQFKAVTPDLALQSDRMSSDETVDADLKYIKTIGNGLLKSLKN